MGYKARIVAKGFHQQQGVDYMDTFSPVIKSTTIRIVWDLAVNSDWHVRQIDVSTLFLQGRLQDEVFMAQPPGLQIQIGLIMYVVSVKLSMD